MAGAAQVIQGCIQLGLGKLQGQRSHKLLLVEHFPLSSAWNVRGVHASSAARITKAPSKRCPHHEERTKAAAPGSSTITSAGKAQEQPWEIGAGTLVLS